VFTIPFPCLWALVWSFPSLFLIPLRGTLPPFTYGHPKGCPPLPPFTSLYLPLPPEGRNKGGTREEQGRNKEGKVSRKGIRKETYQGPARNGNGITKRVMGCSLSLLVGISLLPTEGREKPARKGKPNTLRVCYQRALTVELTT
jgi:hypothetical protein